jgi:serine/threonine-protein kinase
MAPEVAIGEGDVDARADLHALGCVGYFLLSGTMVFEDTNPMKVALKHVQTVPDPPSARTELPIPPDLERVILRCLEKSPAARPATAGELGELLGQCAVPPWSERDAAAWWDRHLPRSSSLRSFAQPATHTPPVVQKV